MQYSKYDVHTPTTSVPELGGALIATPEFRGFIGREVGSLLIGKFALTPEGVEKIEAVQLTTHIFNDCFSDIGKLSHKYEGIELRKDFADNWLDFGESLIGDLRSIYRDYIDDPENHQKFTELFSRFPEYRRAKNQAPLGSRPRAKYDKLHKEYTEDLFAPGIREGVRTAVAYYEVASHMTDGDDYPIELIGPVRRLLIKHSGVDQETNDQLLEKLRRTPGESYDDLLFDPDLFKVVQQGDRKELATVKDKVQVEGCEFSIPVGCPAFSHGTIGRLCGVIETVIAPKRLASKGTPRASGGDLIPVSSDILLGDIPAEYRAAYIDAYDKR